MAVEQVTLFGKKGTAETLGGGLLKIVFHDGSVMIAVPSVAKAEKQPLYVSRSLLNGDEVVAWAKSQGFPETLQPRDMHVTIAYSKAPMDVDKLTPVTRALAISGGKRSVHPLGDEGAVVLEFTSQQLSAEWKALCDSGASWDYDSYSPHITITYNAPKDLDLTKVEPFTGLLKFSKQKYEVLDEDWKSTVVEKANRCHVPSGSSAGGQFCSSNNKGFGLTNFGDERGDAPPSPGTPFKVFRVGSGSPSLENRNAGNAEAIADYLAKVADPSTSISTTGDMVSLYEVIIPDPFSEYEGLTRNQILGNNRDKVGRVSTGDQRSMSTDTGEVIQVGNRVSYSFPERGKFQERKIRSIPITEIMQTLQKRYNYSDFDESGYGIGSDLLRKLFDERIQKGDEDTIPPTPLLPHVLSQSPEKG